MHKNIPQTIQECTNKSQQKWLITALKYFSKKKPHTWGRIIKVTIPHFLLQNNARQLRLNFYKDNNEKEGKFSKRLCQKFGTEVYWESSATLITRSTGQKLTSSRRKTFPGKKPGTKGILTEAWAKARGREPLVINNTVLIKCHQRKRSLLMVSTVSCHSLHNSTEDWRSKQQNTACCHVLCSDIQWELHCPLTSKLVNKYAQIYMPSCS